MKYIFFGIKIIKKLNLPAFIFQPTIQNDQIGLKTSLRETISLDSPLCFDGCSAGDDLDAVVVIGRTVVVVGALVVVVGAVVVVVGALVVVVGALVVVVGALVVVVVEGTVLVGVRALIVVVGALVVVAVVAVTQDTGCCIGIGNMNTTG